MKIMVIQHQQHFHEVFRTWIGRPNNKNTCPAYGLLKGRLEFSIAVPREMDVTQGGTISGRYFLTKNSTLGTGKNFGFRNLVRHCKLINFLLPLFHCLTNRPYVELSVATPSPASPTPRTRSARGARSSARWTSCCRTAPARPTGASSST